MKLQINRPGKMGADASRLLVQYCAVEFKPDGNMHLCVSAF